jgi:hypothetical protein
MDEGIRQKKCRVRNKDGKTDDPSQRIEQEEGEESIGTKY